MRNKLIFLLKVFISGVLLYLIILKIDWSQLLVSIRRGHLFSLCLALCFSVLFNLIKFMKWYTLINASSNHNSYWDGAKSYMIGNALGLVTPMRVGDIGRALYFPQKDRPKIIGLTIIDRLLDLTIVFILAILGSFVLINKGFGILIFSLSVFCLLLLYSPGMCCRTIKKLITHETVREKFNKFLDVFQMLNFKIITRALILSFFAFFTIIIEFYYLVKAFEDISFQSIFLVTPLVTLSSVVPVSLLGLGVREGLSIILFSKFGISATTALSAAFLFFFLNNVTISLIGLFYLSRIEIAIKKTIHKTQNLSTSLKDADSITGS